MPGASNVPWSAPLTRLRPWYPGQYGVPGAEHTRGLRLDTNGIVLWVDPNHTDANDNRDGTEPTSPLATVDAALSRCRAYRGDVIVVAPNSQWTYADTSVGRATAIVEEIIIDVPGVRLIGLFPSSSLGVPWSPVADNGTCITVHAMDVLIEGFCFWNAENVNNPIAIMAEWTAPNYGDNLTVRHCYFAEDLDYGIQLDFAWWCHIHDNVFDGLQVAAIHSLDVEGDPDYSLIHDNLFMGCVVAINLEDSGNCMIYRNAIYGDATGTNNFIDLTGGADNIVFDNWLACTTGAQYNTTCSDATSGAWVNNHCIDADTGAAPT
jgi:hypothetical protein